MHTRPLSRAQRAEIEKFIAEIESREFWRPLTQTEKRVLSAARRRLAEARCGGSPFLPESEPLNRASRRHVPRHHRKPI